MEKLGFEQIFTNEYATGYANREKGIVALIAEADYIPIKQFKQLFQMLTDEIEGGEGDFHKFIFDKRALRTFHQPSMKWYFTEWKTAMLEHGLNKHFKILPDLPYFVKAVEAARKPLLKKYPEDVLKALRIEYYDDVESAVKAE